MAIYLGNTPIAENVTIQQGGGVTIDDTLSDTSEHPVQNKVITNALNTKANLTDIPTSLPANGGNADTLDGKHASDFALSDNPSIEGEIKLLRANNATTTSTIFAWEETARIRNIDPNAEKQTYTDLIVTPEGIYTEGFSNGEIKVRKNIADGGNAATLETHHASDFALKTDIPTTLPANGGNSNTTNHQINHYLGQNVDILTYAASDNCPYNLNTKVRIMNSPTCPTNYGYNAAENDFWYDIYKLDNLWVQIKAYDVRRNVEFINSCVNGTWSGWIRCNDGGNAATVNGYTVNANVPAGFSPDNMMSKTNPTGTGSFSLNRKADTTIGDYSFAEGSEATASGRFSHAEGSETTASGLFSHAEGEGTTASADDSHAEGLGTLARGNSSHAEGEGTIASGNSSHAEGQGTIASNYASHASGKYNAAMTTGGSNSNTAGTAFVIGNGTGPNALSNAFSVQYSGIVKAKSTITASTTADYAEFFEWLDGNPDDEDRVGYFVTLDGDKIRIATAADDYILGVVSGEPFVLGNGDCDTWNGMYLHDEFRRTIYEPAPKMVEILDREGNPTGEYEEVEGEFEGTRPKLNPEYDHTQPYISRLDRKEWAPVGMLGVLAVRHDGTAQVNGYVTVNANGIATACEKNAENAYRVIKSNTDSVVEIIFR